MEAAVGRQKTAVNVQKRPFPAICMLAGAKKSNRNYHSHGKQGKQLEAPKESSNDALFRLELTCVKISMLRRVTIGCTYFDGDM